MKKYKILRGEYKGKIVESVEENKRMGLGNPMKLGISFPIEFCKCTIAKFDNKGRLNYEEVE